MLSERVFFVCLEVLPLLWQLGIFVEIMWHCWIKEDLKTDSSIIQYLQNTVTSPSILVLPYLSSPLDPRPFCLIRKEQAFKR